jgi:tetratricopeptide (TPR) repeat protein
VKTCEFDLAIADYNQTIKLKPDYSGIYYDRGWTYAGKDDHARALNDYNRAIELDKDNPDLYNDRGSTFATLGDLDHALAVSIRSLRSGQITRLVMPIVAGCWRRRTNTSRRSPNWLLADQARRI